MKNSNVSLSRQFCCGSINLTMSHSFVFQKSIFHSGLKMIQKVLFKWCFFWNKLWIFTQKPGKKRLFMWFQNNMNQQNEEVYQMVVHFCCNHFFGFWSCSWCWCHLAAIMATLIQITELVRLSLGCHNPVCVEHKSPKRTQDFLHRAKWLMVRGKPIVAVVNRLINKEIGSSSFLYK